LVDVNRKLLIASKLRQTFADFSIDCPIGAGRGAGREAGREAGLA
jgi:hypothetical protein